LAEEDGVPVLDEATRREEVHAQTEDEGEEDGDDVGDRGGGPVRRPGGRRGDGAEGMAEAPGHPRARQNLDRPQDPESSFVFEGIGAVTYTTLLDVTQCWMDRVHHRDTRQWLAGQVSTACFKKAVQSLPLGKAIGPSGAAAEVVRPVLLKNDELAALWLDIARF